MSKTLRKSLLSTGRAIATTSGKTISKVFGLLALGLGLAPISANAQLLYSQVQSVEPYVNIATPTGTIVNAAVAQSDDAVYNNLPIGFTFRFNGTDYTSFSTTDNGVVQLGNAYNSSSFQPLNAQGNAVISIFPLDLHSGATGVFSYAVTGTAPNRVLTIEYKNWNFYGSREDNSVSVNGQVKLFETDNIIKITYGRNVVTITRGTQVGIRGNSNTEVLSRSLATAGLWSTSTASTSPTETFDFSPTSFPDSGLTYTYTPLPPSNNDVAFVGLRNLPNSFQRLCDSSQVFPAVRMRNLGLNSELVSGTVQLFRNDTIISTLPFGPISIAVDTIIDVSLGAYQLNGLGNYRFRVINELGDEVSANDTVLASVTVGRSCQRLDYAVSVDSTTAFTPIDSAAGFEFVFQYETEKTLPFFFRYDNIVTNRITITIDGHLVIGDAFTSFSNTPLAFGEYVVSPFGTALDVTNVDDIKYQIVGAAPNRRAIVQWTNMTDGFIFNAPEPLPSNSSYTFQAIISEADNSITFAYDSIFVADNAARPQIGINRNDERFNAFTLTTVDGNIKGIREVKDEQAVVRVSANNDATARGFNLKFTPPVFTGNDLALANLNLTGDNGVALGFSSCDSSSITPSVVVVNTSDVASAANSIRFILVDINSGDNIDTIEATVDGGLARFGADTIIAATPFFITNLGDYSVIAQLITNDDDSTNNVAEFSGFSFEIRECSPIPFANFNFTTTEDYIPVATCAPRVVTGTGVAQDDNENFQTLPFPVTYNGETFNNVWISNNGYAILDNTNNEFLPITGILTQYPNALTIFNADLYVTDTANGGVFAEVRGAAPNRYYVIEWRNTTYFNFDNRNVLLNFQIHIYENGNIRYVYGNNGNPNTFIPVVVGLNGSVGAIQTRTMFLNDTSWAANFASRDPNNALITNQTITAENGMSFAWFNGILEPQATGIDISLTANGAATTTVCAGTTIAPIELTRTIVSGNAALSNAFLKVITTNGATVTRDSIALTGTLTYCDAPLLVRSIGTNGFAAPGTYVVQAFLSVPGAFNTANDTVTRTFVVQPQSPTPDISATATNICAGDSVTITATNEADVYAWSNGATTRSIRVAAAGNYFLRTNATGACLSAPSDTIAVSLNPATSVTLTATLDSTTRAINFVSDALNADSVVVTINGVAQAAGTGSFTPTTDGVYLINAIAFGTCGNDTSSTTVVITNTGENKPKPTVAKWPNPIAADILFLTINPFNDKATVSLSTTTGIVVYSSIVTDSKSSIDVSQLPSGVYVLRVEMDGFAPYISTVAK